MRAAAAAKRAVGYGPSFSSSSRATQLRKLSTVLRPGSSLRRRPLLGAPTRRQFENETIVWRNTVDLAVKALSSSSLNFRLHPELYSPSCNGKQHQSFSTDSASSVGFPGAGGRLLTTSEKELLEKERQILERMLSALNASGPHPPDSQIYRDITLLKKEIERLDDLFLLVVVGEFNSGKSSLINALLGRYCLPEGPIPTTSEICLVKYGEKDVIEPLFTSSTSSSSLTSSQPSSADLAIRTVSEPWMKHVNIVDTPGTNAIDRHHETLTREFVPRADLLLFVTSADRPFSESERQFLDSIRRWGKKSVMIINKVDLLSEKQLGEVKTYVRDRARNVLGTAPRVFTVSAKKALDAKLQAAASLNSQTEGESSAEVDTAEGGAERRKRKSISKQLETMEQWQTSHFSELEQLVFNTLDSDERLRLKLDSPAGVAAALAGRYISLCEGQSQILAGDLKSLQNLETAMKMFRNDMLNDFQAHLARVDNILLDMLERAEVFLDEKLTMGNAYKLITAREELSKDFEKTVGGNTADLVRERVDEIAEWMIQRSSRQFTDAIETFERRLSVRESSMAQHKIHFFDGGSQQQELEGGNAFQSASARSISRFDVTRNDVIRKIKEAVTVAKSYDHSKEGQKLTSEIQSAIVLTAAMEVGALGIFGALISASMMDVTVLASTSAVMILGAAVLPYRRRAIKTQLRGRVTTLRQKLKDILIMRCNEQVENVDEAIKDAIMPFSRFVRVSATTVELQHLALREAVKDIESIRKEISQIGGGQGMSAGESFSN